jgi:hypothetical protein
VTGKAQEQKRLDWLNQVLDEFKAKKEQGESPP